METLIILGRIGPPDGIQIPKGRTYGKDFNPAVIMNIDFSAFPMVEYPAYLKKQYEQSKKQMMDYNKKKAEYDKSMKEYQQKMKDYEKKKKDYDKKFQEYIKNNPDIIA